jgi:HEXXH motif-containing protein
VGRGFSSHLFRGAIFLDPPASDEHRIEAYAINFAHELGHQALFVYQCADPIIDGALDAPVYSVIRRVPRPAILSFHAVVAAAYMAEFVGDWLDAGAESTARLHYLRRRLAENVELVENGAAALSVVQFTELGEQILDEMRGLVAYLRIRHAIQ